MSAPVRVDAPAFSDPRIELLGELAGYNRHEALGRLVLLWSTCTERETEILSDAIVRGCLGTKGVDAILGADLAERVDEGLRIRGTRGRVEWLGAERAKRSLAASAGGRARAASANRVAGRFQPAGTSEAPAPDQPATSDSPAANQRLTSGDQPAPASPSPSPSLSPVPFPSPEIQIPPNPPGGGEAQSVLALVAPAAQAGDTPKRTRRKRSSEPSPEEWPQVERILAKLSDRTGVQFTPRNHKGEPTSHVSHVLRRLREDYTEHDLRLVLWHLDEEWSEEKNPEMRRHLNPETVFGRKKFETYLAQAQAAWAAAGREDELREHHRRKNAPVSPIVASLLEGDDLPFEHLRKPEPKRDVRVGRVEPLDAEAYNRAAAEAGEF